MMPRGWCLDLDDFRILALDLSIRAFYLRTAKYRAEVSALVRRDCVRQVCGDLTQKMPARRRKETAQSAREQKANVRRFAHIGRYWGASLIEHIEIKNGQHIPAPQSGPWAIK